MKARPVIIIAATLCIGFLLGMLTSAQIRYHRLNHVRMFFSHDRFREEFYKTIQPEGQQREKIDAVLDKYARLTGDMQTTFRRELDSVMKEFRTEIDGYLTSDQIGRLREMDERRQKMVHRRWDKHPADSSGSAKHKHHGSHSSGSDNPEHPVVNPADSAGLK